jgi:hypothetical protein
VPQAGELAELDHLGRDRVLDGKPVECIVECEQIFVRGRGREAGASFPPLAKGGLGGVVPAKPAPGTRFGAAGTARGGHVIETGAW